MTIRPTSRADNYTTGVNLGTAPDHKEDFVWTRHNRGFLLSPAGLSGLGFSLTGITTWKDGQVWASRHKYFGTIEDFFVKPKPIQEADSDEMTGLAPDFRAGLTINAADVGISEWDWVLNRNVTEMDPDVVQLNPYTRSFRRREWGNTGGGSFGESTGAYGSNTSGNYGPANTDPPIGPYHDWGPANTDLTFGANTGEWGGVDYDHGDGTEEPGGAETPGLVHIPRFVWVGDEFDCGEPDTLKQVYIMMVSNTCRQAMYVNIARKESVGQSAWYMDSWQRLNPGQATAGFSLAGMLFKPFVHVYQWEKFKLAPVTIKFKVVDRRLHHVAPSLVLEATK